LLAVAAPSCHPAGGWTSWHGVPTAVLRLAALEASLPQVARRSGWPWDRRWSATRAAVGVVPQAEGRPAGRPPT